MKYLLGAATAALLLAGATAASAATNQSTQSVNATATILSPVAISVTNNMSFGKLVLDGSATAGTVTLGTDGSRTPLGGVNLVTGGGEQAALVKFTPDATNGTSNVYNVTTDASTLLNSGTDNMTVDTFTLSATTGTGIQSISIGAKLHVASNQPAGVYNGTFNVYANYQ
jgi:hypothetical protein